MCNPPYCQPYKSYNASSENLVLDQLIIPKLIFFFILNHKTINVYVSPLDLVKVKCLISINLYTLYIIWCFSLLIIVQNDH